MPSRILTAQARPRPPLPLWVPITLGLFLVSRPLSTLESLGAELVSALLTLGGGVAGIAAAVWLEETIFGWMVGRHPLLRLLGSWILPPLALASTVVLLILCGIVATAWKPFEPAIFLVLTSGLWVALASFGTSLIATVDVLVSAVVQSFRARLAVAVFTLLGAVVGGCALLSGWVVWLVGELRSGRSLQLEMLNAPPERIEDIRGRIDAAFRLFADSPQFVTAIVFVLVLILCAPAVISACVKLAEVAMERLHPLSMALDAVARGERDLRVEEAGSIDFVRLAKRFNRMIDSLALAERMERAFGMYVSGHLMDRIRAQHGEALLPPSLREATVFFADIRGFTQISERLGPRELVSMLNRYFGRVVTVVTASDGYLNKFIGDAVVVVFNGPIDQADHAARAVNCAIALQQAVEEMNAQGLFPEVPGGLKIGVGVASGPMVCGNVGGALQVEYTVIGDTVNLASRLTSSAGAGEILINATAAKALPPEIKASALEPIRVKGKADPVVPWKVTSARPQRHVEHADRVSG